MWRGVVEAMEARMKEMAHEAYTERRELLDRIQHPEVRQVQATEPVDYEPPKDQQELAFVGEEVPEFVQVGEPGGPD